MEQAATDLLPLPATAHVCLILLGLYSAVGVSAC